jgi:hypothetical protein
MFEKCDIVYSNDNEKCAPGIKFNEGSCFNIEQLIHITKLYNKHNLDNQIIISDNKNKKELLKLLIKKLEKKYDCKDQKCWIEKINFIKSDYNLKHFVFRPKGPINTNKWLSTKDIDKSLKQYEKKYKKFFYLGTLPNDFKYLDYYGVWNYDFLKKVKNGICKFGSVINLDNHNQSGSHWVSLYFDINEKKIYYFDSFAKKPGKRISEFIEKIIKLMDNNTENIFKKYNNKKKYLLTNEIIEEIKLKTNVDYRINNIRHQFKNSECGVYSMNFIIRLLNNESFDNITKNVTNDDYMNNCRNTYFR